MLADWEAQEDGGDMCDGCHAAMKICSPSPPKPLRMPASCTTTSVWSAWTALFWWCPMTARPSGRELDKSLEQLGIDRAGFEKLVKAVMELDEDEDDD